MEKFSVGYHSFFPHIYRKNIHLMTISTEPSQLVTFTESPELLSCSTFKLVLRVKTKMDVLAYILHPDS